MIKTTLQFICDYCGAEGKPWSYMYRAGGAQLAPSDHEFGQLDNHHICTDCREAAREGIIARRTHGE